MSAGLTHQLTFIPIGRPEVDAVALTPLSSGKIAVESISKDVGTHNTKVVPWLSTALQEAGLRMMRDRPFDEIEWRVEIGPLA